MANNQHVSSLSRNAVLTLKSRILSFQSFLSRKSQALSLSPSTRVLIFIKEINFKQFSISVRLPKAVKMARKRPINQLFQAFDVPSFKFFHPKWTEKYLILVKYQMRYPLAILIDSISIISSKMPSSAPFESLPQLSYAKSKCFPPLLPLTFQPPFSQPPTPNTPIPPTTPQYTKLPLPHTSSPSKSMKPAHPLNFTKTNDGQKFSARLRCPPQGSAPGVLSQRMRNQT